MLHEELLSQLAALEEQSSDSMREFDKNKVSAEQQLNSLLETQRKIEELAQLKESFHTGPSLAYPVPVPQTEIFAPTLKRIGSVLETGTNNSSP